MFKNNKYTKIYYQIINRAKARDNISVYTENHHIIPKSLSGNDKKENLVVLTAREHFICHMLLTKMTDGADYKKMIHAFWLMCNYSSGNQERNYIINSVIYENLKKNRSKILTGVSRSEEIRNKISETTKGRPKKPFSEEHKRNLKKSLKGNIPWNKGKTGLQVHSDETKTKMSRAAKGRKKSEEHLEALSKSRQNKVNCFDKKEEKHCVVTTEVFRSSNIYIGYKSKEYQTKYKGA